MSDLLLAFIQCLRDAEEVLSAEIGLGPGVEEIADMLWLAEQLSGPHSETEHRDDEEENSGASSSSFTEQVELRKKKDSEELLAAQEVPTTEPVGTLVTHPERSERTSATTQVKPIRVPAAAALRHPIKLARSLRRLVRKTESRTQEIVDEEATAIAIAEKNPVGIVQKPARERWLELELVVDYSRVGAIWERTCKEFVELLERLGAFRTVRVWTLETHTGDNGSHVPVLTSGLRSPDGKPSRLGKPKELVDPTGQRMVMLLSDCISPLWRGGIIHSWLADWAKNGPTVIVQWFPEEYWSRTGLKSGDEVWLSAFSPGLSCDRLTRRYRGINPEDWANLLEEPEASRSVTIPVVTLEP